MYKDKKDWDRFKTIKQKAPNASINPVSGHITELPEAGVEDNIWDSVKNVDDRGVRGRKPDIGQDIINTITLKEKEVVDGKPYFSTPEGYKWLERMADLGRFARGGIAAAKILNKLLSDYGPPSPEKGSQEALNKEKPVGEPSGKQPKEY